MARSRQLGMRTKIITALLAFTAIVLVVGGIGWSGIRGLGQKIDLIGGDSLPTVQVLNRIDAAYLQKKVALRTLLSSELEASEYQNQLQKERTADEDFHKAMAEYEAMPRTAEEDAEFQPFKASSERFDALSDKISPELSSMIGTGNLKAANYQERAATLIMNKEMRDAGNDLEQKLQALVDFINAQYVTKVLSQSSASVAVANISILAGLAIGVALALLLILFIPRSIADPSIAIARDIDRVSASLESASMQVSSSSQELSSGSSELASSIEEMTSSLEELQSIIEATTKNVNEAGIVSTQTMDAATEVVNQTAGLQEAMKDVDENSRKISRIIKTIDDIAFQTNILALNAAVEAARAGEAGRGFAVVAEQVKSLAQKSAQASKETAELIETETASVQKGIRSLEVVRSVIDKAAESVNKVMTLIDEVNRASKEQLKGANQITQGISQINAVVQNTASSSEENAAAGEELLSQAEALKDSVQGLKLVIFGSKAASAAASSAGGPSAAAARRPGAPKATDKAVAQVVKPEDAIPLKDFRDF